MSARLILSEALDFEDCTFVVRGDGDLWVVECYDDGALAASTDVAFMLKTAGYPLHAPPVVEAVPDVDWVSLSQQGMPPVRAGRFIVHGSHDQGTVVSQWAILIDAGRAFGTAHHGSTRGCLMALDRLLHRERIKSVLDIGTGSGILAIAAIKALRHRCSALAVDNDPVAVEVALKNCQKNGVAGKLALAAADGRHGFVRGPFDLITANILANPLISLSPRIRHATRTGGLVILSGFLREQSREVVAAYTARGFVKVKISVFDGWTTAVLRRTI